MGEAHAAPAPTLVVVAAIIVEGGRILVTQRRPGTHLAGLWEFPGGKVEPAEDPRDAVRRELLEELGIDADAGQVLDVVFHRYPSKNVLLLFYAAKRRPDSPAPAPLHVAALQWRAPAALDGDDLPAADLAALPRIKRYAADCAGSA